MKTLTKILGLFPVIALALITIVKLFFKLISNYWKYGCELIIYDKYLQRSDMRMILRKLKESDKEILFKFYAEVCELAESKMLQSGKLEGMHYSAMRELLNKYKND